MERGTTGASASQNHVAGIITTLGATWRTHGDGRIIFPRAPPWRARGYPVPAMLFGGEARAAVNLPSSLRGPLRPLPPSPLSASQPRPVPTPRLPNSRARTPYGETRRVTSASSVFFPNKLSPRRNPLHLLRNNRNEGFYVRKLKFKRTEKAVAFLDSINFVDFKFVSKGCTRVNCINRCARFTGEKVTPPPRYRIEFSRDAPNDIPFSPSPCSSPLFLRAR